MKILNRYKATWGFIIVFIALHIIYTRIDLLYYLSAKGIDLVGHEYYRFTTGPLLHFNFVHILANVIAMFWVGYFIEESLGSIHFVVFALLTSTVAEIINSFVFPSSLNNIGGSVYVFAFLGLIAATQILKSGFPKFHLKTWYGNWLVSYAVIGNIPIFSFMGISTIVIHLISFITGIVIGALGISFNIIRCKGSGSKELY